MKLPPELEEHRIFKGVLIVYGIAIATVVIIGALAWILHLK